MKKISTFLAGLIYFMAIILTHNEVFADPIALSGLAQEAILIRYPELSGIHAYQLKDRIYLLDKWEFPEFDINVLKLIEKEKTVKYRMKLL